MLGAVVVAAVALATGVSEADKAAAARSAAVAALSPTVTWTKRTSAGKKNWNGITSDATGLRLAARVWDGHILTSTNGGESWTKQTASGVNFWKMIDSSDSGARIVAIASDVNVHVSTNGGRSWTQATVAAGATSATAVSCTRDCRTIAISRFDTGGELSTDGGISWASFKDPSGSEPSFGIAVSADTDANGVPLASIGITKQGFQDHPFSSVLVKTGTADWRRVSVDDSADFSSVAVNQDGSVMLAGARYDIDLSDGDSNGVYVSYNGGISWSKRILLPSAEEFHCYQVAMDDFGATMAAYVKHDKEFAFLSLDGGVSWAKQPLDVSEDVRDLAVAVSGDGTRIVVTARGGYIYTGVVNPLPGPEGWLAWEYQTAMGVALGATAAGVPISTAALREK